VAAVLANDGDVTDPVTLVAAVLHDTLEDTKTTPEELANAFSPTIRDPKHRERRGGADARGRLRFGAGSERGAGDLRDEKTAWGGPHGRRDAVRREEWSLTSSVRRV